MGRLLPMRKDVWLAAVLIVVSQVEVWRYGAGGGTPIAAATLGTAAALVAWRSRAPILMTALIGVALTACAHWAGEPFSATSVATVTVGFFTIGELDNRLRSMAVLVVAMLIGLVITHPLTINLYLSITFTSFVVPWLLGLLWSHRHRAAELGRAREEAATAAVRAERSRLARELHDVVSHNVGMIAVQAGAADVLLDKDPERSRESLRAIEGGARETLLELRRLLGLLREDDPDPLTMTPSLTELGRIVEPAGLAGVHVQLRTEGVPADVGQSIELAAYRVVQEALTNAVAHAGPCTVTVTLSYRSDALEVDVADNGTAPGGTAGGGYGLAGLRERVALLGGTLEAGPRAGGGFRVHALIPMGQA